MVKLKKNSNAKIHFVLILTFFLFISCSHQHYYVTKVEGKQIGITKESTEVAAIEYFVKPYRENIDKDLNTVLAYAPETIDKTGIWQTPMGNLLADIAFQKGNVVFKSRENKNIDICLLNSGGIRTIIGKGDVTSKTAFEIMPFENKAIVVALKGDQILEIVDYFITGKKPHPIAGITFTISINGPKNILIQGKPIENERVYYVITNDYLANGGDKMVFFKKGIATYDLDYKLRNMIIDYFKETKTIPVINDIRISTEN